MHHDSHAITNSPSGTQTHVVEMMATEMLDKSQVEKAVSALLKLVKKTSSATKIVDQPEKIDLQLTLKVIPKVTHKTVKLKLPHSIHYDTREVCLFVKDLDVNDREYEKTVWHYQDLFRQKGIAHISKIVPLKALRTDYSMPSSKRSLAKAYDLFLADGTVVGMLPGTLGKIFYAKKKSWPVQVNLRAGNLKKELENVIVNSRLVIDGKGSSSMAMVAHDRMAEEHIISNILAAANQIAEKVPGGGSNIRNFLIKCSSTTSIPIFVSFGDPSNVEMPEFKEKPIESATDDVTTVENGKVFVQADGVVQVVKKRVKSENSTDAADIQNSDGIGASPRKRKKLQIKKESEDSSQSESSEIKKDLRGPVKHKAGKKHVKSSRTENKPGKEKKGTVAKGKKKRNV